jgi:nuclear pore complex protein Nup98-Nup96
VGSLVPRKASIKKLAIPKASLTDDAATAESAGSHAAALDAAGEPAALKYGEYYMLPSEAVLKKMSYSQLAAVPSLVIGQKGVGRLRFLQPVDLTGVDLDMILDNIVVFDNHQVVIYPEDEYHQTERPPAGQGLNLPAECRLERCWPTARSSRDPITEMGSERMRRHIQRLQQVPGTHFIDYIPESGTWIFKVDHF